MPKIYARQLQDAGAELGRALKKYKRFNSAHEGWAVIFEEVRELEKEVFKRAKKRRVQKMRAEACQIAAMALRFMMEVCDR